MSVTTLAVRNGKMVTRPESKVSSTCEVCGAGFVDIARRYHTWDEPLDLCDLCDHQLGPPGRYDSSGTPVRITFGFIVGSLASSYVGAVVCFTGADVLGVGLGLMGLGLAISASRKLIEQRSDIAFNKMGVPPEAVVALKEFAQTHGFSEISRDDICPDCGHLGWKHKNSKHTGNIHAGCSGHRHGPDSWCNCQIVCKD